MAQRSEFATIHGNLIDSMARNLEVIRKSKRSTPTEIPAAQRLERIQAAADLSVASQILYLLIKTEWAIPPEQSMKATLGGTDE